MRSTTFLFGLLLIPLLSSCASIFSGMDQKMTFKSEPDGATVYFDGLAMGTTPLQLLLRRDEFKEVRFSKPGYRDEIIQLNTRIDKIVILNTVLTSAHTTDAMTGAMFEYYPNAHFVNLQKISGKSRKTGRLDRQLDNDLKQYVMTYYNVIKQQCESRCDNAHMDTLVTLISDGYKKDKGSARQLAIQALHKTTEPVDYLRQLEVNIMSRS